MTRSHSSPSPSKPVANAAGANAAQLVYSFGAGQDAVRGGKELLGGKGANLAEMAGLGLPVPPGFTITTRVCNDYYKNDKQYAPELTAQVEAALQQVEQAVGKSFGDSNNPLLVSVRSGAAVSMPGMMDTILNLGLNDTTVEALARQTSNPRFAWDSYRRLIQMYGDVVMGTPHEKFSHALETYKEQNGYSVDPQMTADDWQQIVDTYKAIIRAETGEDFPQDVQQQLWAAITSVFDSWMNDRAITYRKLYHIDHSIGTAVNVQAMVFGNLGDSSATGVAFTRNPSTGENALYGEFLINAQGEDVVAGIRTPQQLTPWGKAAVGSDLPCMQEVMPEMVQQIQEIRQKLEQHYRDMQDIEFTVENGKLWMLQTRTGKRTAQAALKIAVDMVDEKLIEQKEALLRVNAADLDQLLHSRIDEKAPKEVLGRGLPASPGAVSGILVFSANDAEEKNAQGINVILARTETSPDDIHGMYAAKGILTTRGGMTSHAAVVARGMGCTCVAGAGTLKIDEKAGTLTAANGRVLRAGNKVTLDGSTGEIFAGEVPTLPPAMTGEFGTFMSWADSVRKLNVRANAETEQDVKTAIEFGAEGIGLARTEHMFFEPRSLMAMREMIMAESTEARRQALFRVLDIQRQDFATILRLMEGKPVTIRLLDPPLHEFLPHSHPDVLATAKAINLPFDNEKQAVEHIKARVGALREVNPMLGHRGCRLGITYPEVYETQVRAMLEAAVDVKQETGTAPNLEIMVPLVASVREIDTVKTQIQEVAEAIFAEKNDSVPYMIGTMIELPRACMRADSIAKRAEFFSFGTNDLTQTTYGISRDDSGMFIQEYVDQGLVDGDPFVTLDTWGVGELIEIAVERGRRIRPDLKIGICGEHGGEPKSVEFCHRIGLDYVSCSPYRVPIARLSAAQAVLRGKKTAAEIARERDQAA